MKKVIFLFMCISTSLLSHAQLKKVELYDLIKSLLPDSSQAASEVNWTGLKSNTLVKWPNTKLNSFEKKYSLSEAKTNITIKGKALYKAWDIDLEGNATGYNHLTISPAEFGDLDFETKPEDLFGKKQYTYKVFKIKEHIIGDGDAYEIKVNGKKLFYMYSHSETAGNTGSKIYIDVFFIQKDLKTFCAGS